MLISNTKLASMRRIANRALITDVAICRKTTTTDNYGGDPKPSWPAGETVKGWILMTNTPSIDDRNGIVTSVGQFRLNIPASTTGINVGDQIDIEGRRYMVQDTNEDDSYRIYTTLALKRIDARDF